MNLGGSFYFTKEIPDKGANSACVVEQVMDDDTMGVILMCRRREQLEDVSIEVFELLYHAFAFGEFRKLDDDGMRDDFGHFLRRGTFAGPVAD